jgi:hypothetical protein
MPNANRVQTQYVISGNPDTVNVSDPYFAGQIGQSIDVGDREYQFVQLDSGATASTATGVVAANQLAYWHDRSQYIVTNDAANGLRSGTANSFRNNVAGVFRNAMTAGNYGFILQRGRNITVNEAGSATAGMILICGTSTTAAQTLGVAINTAPNCLPLGICTVATSGSTCTADLDISGIP